MKKTKNRAKIRNIVKKHFQISNCSNKKLAELILGSALMEDRDYSKNNAKTIIKIFYCKLCGESIDFLDKPKKSKKSIDFVQTNEFLQSFQWRRCRMIALKANDGRCECCGRSKHDGIILHVDHIKPRKEHPELALEPKNLQVLCNECNHGKGNWDETDWRISKEQKLTNMLKGKIHDLHKTV